MISNLLRLPALRIVVAVALVLLIPAQALLARGGGQHWGYHPQAGGPLNMWFFGSPWAALYGAGIPHHNIDPPHGGSGYSTGGGMSYGGGGTQFPTIDRSVAFPGSSSNLSTALPSFSTPAPTGPYRTEKRFDPPYYDNYNGYWHHGYWGGGQWGWANWGGPLGIGSFARWSMGPVYYVSGYGQFRNPFLNESDRNPPPHLDYSKVIEDREDDDEPETNSASSDPGGTPPTKSGEETEEDRLAYLVKSPEVNAGLKHFDAATEAFQKKDYELALQKTNAALQQIPFDVAIHEYRALNLFARGEYESAAATLYAVLAVSPGWDWTTLASRYTDQEEFPRHLRTLEAYHKEHPDSAAAAFLRGYHYTTCRHFETAVKQFQTVVKLLPDDELIPALAALIEGAVEKSPATETTDAVPSPRPTSTGKSPEQDDQPIAVAKLLGEWKAFRAGATSIELKLRNGDVFSWTATRDGKTRRIAGRYLLHSNVLFLEGGSGTLIGRVQRNKQGGFHFTLVDGGPPNAGIDFAAAVRNK